MSIHAPSRVVARALGAMLVAALAACQAAPHQAPPTPVIEPTVAPPPTAAPIEPTATEWLPPTPLSVPSETPVSDLRAEMGEPIQYGPFLFMVLGWTAGPASYYRQATEGVRLVGVQLLALSRYDQDWALRNTVRLVVRDGAGNVSKSSSWDYEPAGVASVGELRPGERVQGLFWFQVRADAQDLELIGQGTGVFPLGDFYVPLGETPVQLDPPGDLDGETVRETVPAGGVATLKPLNLSVVGVQVQRDFPAWYTDGEGYKLLIVSLRIENPADYAVPLAEKDDVRVEWPSGLRSRASGTFDAKTLGGRPIGGSLAAGATETFTLPFLIPADLTTVTLIVPTPQDPFNHVRLAVTWEAE